MIFHNIISIPFRVSTIVAQWWETPWNYHLVKAVLNIRKFYWQAAAKASPKKGIRSFAAYHKSYCSQTFLMVVWPNSFFYELNPHFYKHWNGRCADCCSIEVHFQQALTTIDINREMLRNDDRSHFSLKHNANPLALNYPELKTNVVVPLKII